MRVRCALPAGVVALAIWVVALILASKVALLAWLVAFAACSSVPIGCLAILMMVTLVPGKWRDLYLAPLLTGSAFLPLVAIALVPILIGVAILYPWTNATVTAGYPAFKAAWLSPAFFVVRQLLYLAILLGFWLLMLLAPFARIAAAGFGLIVYAIIASSMGVDLVESLRPDFHSSEFGLLFLSGQWLAGISFGILLGLAARPGGAPLAGAGPFAVALLCWAYLHAMQFIVIWAADIPDEVIWYLDRGVGIWAVITPLLFLVQGFGPFFAILSPTVRNSRRSMIAIAVVTLAMRVVESAWLILPGEAVGWAVAPLIVVAVIAMGGLGIAAVQRVARDRPRWINPGGWAVEARSA